MSFDEGDLDYIEMLRLKGNNEELIVENKKLKSAVVDARPEMLKALDCARDRVAFIERWIKENL